MRSQFYVRPAGAAFQAELESDEPMGSYINGVAAELTETNPWDQAHALKKELASTDYIEPDLENQNMEADAAMAGIIPDENNELFETLADDEYDPAWPHPTHGQTADKQIWHINAGYSQLKTAWELDAEAKNVVRICHFDTGYDPGHTTFPKNNIEFDLQRNFVEGGRSAEDTGSEGWLKMPGHGPGTLSILAGNLVDLPQYHYNGYLGVHGKIRIVPVRIAKSVVLWKNKAFVDALEYVISLYDDPDTRCHIITMSMGGMPSKAWADVVNRAYEKGILIVTAAGNNFGRLTPSSLVYPARFGRVTAACGVTYDYSPYYKHFSPGNADQMQGNFGPRKVMKKAIAAFTPNVPWAIYKSGNVVSLNGAGTSSATPQIAAAAALYYQRYFDELELLNGWEKVEKIRGALFDAASGRIAEGYDNDVELYFGNGVLQAEKMLSIPPSAVGITYQDPDEVNWPFLKLITGLSVFESTEEFDEGSLEMFETEILQIISRSIVIQQLLDHEEKEYMDLTEPEQKVFFQLVHDFPETSASLRSFIEDLHLNG